MKADSYRQAENLREAGHTSIADTIQETFQQWQKETEENERQERLKAETKAQANSQVQLNLL